jgi:hypothetical protein
MRAAASEFESLGPGKVTPATTLASGAIRLTERPAQPPVPEAWDKEIFPKPASDHIPDEVF